VPAGAPADAGLQIRPLRRFKGHQNTSKNFIRGVFGPRQEIIVGGSEVRALHPVRMTGHVTQGAGLRQDAYVYMWDVESGALVSKLAGHESCVYMARWSPAQSLLARCVPSYGCVCVCWTHSCAVARRTTQCGCGGMTRCGLWCATQAHKTSGFVYGQDRTHNSTHASTNQRPKQPI
jgi:hypothetical protein